MIRKMAWVILAAAAIGCSGGSGGSNNNNNNGGFGGSSSNPNPAQSGNYCESACGKLKQCDASADLQTCTASCQNSFATVGPKLRSEFLSYTQSCLGNKDCASVLSGDAEYECMDEAAASLAPTAAATDFCDAVATAASQCGGSAQKGECLEDTKLYSDATLAAAKQCLSKACSEIDYCLNAEFGVSSSSGGGGGSGGSSGGAGGGSNSCEWAFDGWCDEPELCPYGTDSYDCYG